MSVAADVLVVGAGIAGLTAAAHLKRRGLSVAVAERSPAPRAAAAGIVLHPNALACLGHLSPSLRESGAPIERYVAIDPDGTATSVGWDRVWGGLGLPLAVHRRVLARLMLAALAPDGVAWSATPRRLVTGDDAVSVTFGDGVTRRYRLVIGADGVRSWVRGTVTGSADVRFSGHTFLRTTVAARGPMAFPEWRVWRASGSFFGAMPVGRGRMACFLQVPDAAPVKVAPGDTYAFLRRAARELPAEVTGIIAAMELDEPFIARPAFTVSVERWARGRVALIGDAAHAFSPATTQGGGIAVEDAAVLADEIARHGATPAALASYERRRRGRVEAFTRLARLHVTLMDAMQRHSGDHQAGAADPTGSAGTGDSTRWYQRLYGPLLAAP